MQSSVKRALLIALSVGIIVVIARMLHLENYVSLEQLKMRSLALKDFVEQDYVSALLMYIGFYILAITLALPIVAPLAMLGGFLFGIIPGLIYAECAATCGATLSFLLVRYVFSALLQQRYNAQLKSFNNRINEYGHGYLLTLQLMMIFPFFVIVTLAALANVSVWTFIWTSALGSFPFILIYVFAGSKLADIHSMSDILSPSIIGVFVLLALLALLPMLIRKINSMRKKV